MSGNLHKTAEGWMRLNQRTADGLKARRFRRLRDHKPKSTAMTVAVPKAVAAAPNPDETVFIRGRKLRRVVI